MNGRHHGKRGELVSKHQIWSDDSALNERGDAGRDGRTRPARTNSQAQTGTGENMSSCSGDHEQEWQLIHTMLKVLTLTIHT